MMAAATDLPRFGGDREIASSEFREQVRLSASLPTWEMNLESPSQVRSGSPLLKKSRSHESN